MGLSASACPRIASHGGVTDRTPAAFPSTFGSAWRRVSVQANEADIRLLPETDMVLVLVIG